MKWIQDKLKYDYLFADLLKLGWITFNNLVENDIWVDVKEPSVSKAKENQPHVLLIVTEILKKLSNPNLQNKLKNTHLTKYNGMDKRTYQELRFQNSDNLKTKIVHDSTMLLREMDCHNQSMWCGRINYLGKAYFAAMIQKKEEMKSRGATFVLKKDFTGDFEISLAAMTSAENFKTLQEQSMLVKEQARGGQMVTVWQVK